MIDESAALDGVLRFLLFCIFDLDLAWLGGVCGMLWWGEIKREEGGEVCMCGVVRGCEVRRKKGRGVVVVCGMVG